VQQIVTDLSASRSRLDEIDRRADELLAVKAAAPANIRARVKSIHDRSDSINKLRQAKERSLQGANRCVFFSGYDIIQMNWIPEFKGVGEKTKWS
jgi:spectrin beta